MAIPLERFGVGRRCGIENRNPIVIPQEENINRRQYNNFWDIVAIFACNYVRIARLIFLWNRPLTVLSSFTVEEWIILHHPTEITVNPAFEAVLLIEAAPQLKLYKFLQISLHQNLKLLRWKPLPEAAPMILAFLSRLFFLKRNCNWNTCFTVLFICWI